MDSIRTAMRGTTLPTSYEDSKTARLQPFGEAVVAQGRRFFRGVNSIHRVSGGSAIDVESLLAVCPRTGCGTG